NLFTDSAGRADSIDLFAPERSASNIFESRSVTSHSQADAQLFGEAAAPSADVSSEHDLFATPLPGPAASALMPSESAPLLGDRHAEAAPLLGPPEPGDAAPLLRDRHAEAAPLLGDRHAEAAPLLGPPEPGDAPEMVVTSIAQAESPHEEPLEELEPFESLDDHEPGPNHWESDTHASPSNPLLDNQPVVEPPHPRPFQYPEPPSTEDVETLMVSREDIFGPDPEPEEPARWADAASSSATDPLQSLSQLSEDLPIADLSLASLKPPLAPASSDPTAEGLGERANSFLVTLQVLKRRIEEADVPEKGALIDAVDALNQHPYVRVVLETLDD
ncbi:MAG: hypothetical protein AAF449_17180, partial [Myxococcota bacterium]